LENSTLFSHTIIKEYCFVLFLETVDVIKCVIWKEQQVHSANISFYILFIWKKDTGQKFYDSK